MAQWLTNWTRIPEDAGSILATFSGLRIWCCQELWYRSQTQLRSHIAVAVAEARPLACGAPYATGAALKSQKKKKKKKPTEQKTTKLSLKKKINNSRVPTECKIIFWFM